MASYFTLTLDTVGPAGVSISLNSGAAYTATQIVTATIGTSDTPTTGYQMKVYGDVDVSYNENIQATEGASAWISFSASQEVKLSTTDGSKTVNVKIRDDVYNESSAANDSITLDTSAPTVTVNSGPDVSKISKQSGKNSCAFQFQCNEEFKAYKVKIVPATSSINTAGTQIPTTAGSTNMSGTGTFAASTPISCTINGTDYETAAGGDIVNGIVKVFVQDNTGTWSTA